MSRPKIKQFIDLRSDDFERHPIWVGCYTFDYDEEWYDDIDQESFRPWVGETPVSSNDGMFLVRATLQLADGSNYPGFITPAMAPERAASAFRLVKFLRVSSGNSSTDQNAQLISETQPHIFVGQSPPFGFWGGAFGNQLTERRAFYDNIGKEPEAVFPIQISADKGLAKEIRSGRIEGHYLRPNDNVIVER